MSVSGASFSKKRVQLPPVVEDTQEEDMLEDEEVVDNERV